jgi:hypothetical protein
MHRILLLLVGLLTAPLLAREPLCRDLKGLYTPCTSAHRASVGKPTPRHVDPPSAEASTAPAQAKTKPAAIRSVNRTKLCRDLKGLYTPCPH